MNAMVIEKVLKEHRGMLALLLLFAVTAILIWGYLLFFQLQMRDRLHTQWNEKRQLLGDSGSFGNSYQRTQEALNTLLATVPARNELPRILGEITDSVSMHNASTETLSYKPIPLSADKLQRYLLSVSAKGSYKAIKPLLADFQNLNALAYLESVSIVNPDPQNDQLLMNVRMVVTMRLEETQ